MTKLILVVGANTVDAFDEAQPPPIEENMARSHAADVSHWMRAQNSLFTFASLQRRLLSSEPLAGGRVAAAPVVTAPAQHFNSVAVALAVSAAIL
jgi:hypothetical protein